MGVFEDLHADRVTGSLAMFDRMIFKGYLTRLFPNENEKNHLVHANIPRMIPDPETFSSFVTVSGSVHFACPRATASNTEHRIGSLMVLAVRTGSLS